METPSSTRRVTRSQTKAAAKSSTNNSIIPMSKKTEEFEMSVSASRQITGKKQQDRSALIDITNDSPIVGLAKATLLETPSSEMSKKRINSRAIFGTPGSGEALLRGQVKTLLQKVEEEAELSKTYIENSRPYLHHLQQQGLVSSPLNFLAPTPANTPQIPNLSDHQIIELASVTPSPVEDKLVISEKVADIFEGKKQEAEKDLVTRSLIFDFSEKLEGFDSSSEQRKVKMSTSEDDDASVWSIQVNVSSIKDDDGEEEEGLEEAAEECSDEFEYDDDGMLNELCEGISKMNMNGMAKPAGKHTRFVYDSDGELVEVEVEELAAAASETEIKTPPLP